MGREWKEHGKKSYETAEDVTAKHLRTTSAHSMPVPAHSGSSKEKIYEFNVFVSQVIMPGYCVQGTVGHKILNGQKKLEIEGRQTVISSKHRF